MWGGISVTGSPFKDATERYIMNGFDRIHHSNQAFEDDRPTDDIDPAWDDEAAEALLEAAEAAAHSTERMEDSVQMYLREIGQVALLTAEDEIALAEQIVRG